MDRMNDQFLGKSLYSNIERNIPHFVIADDDACEVFTNMRNIELLVSVVGFL